MIDVLLFVLGFVLLIKGADFLIKGAVAISRVYNVSEMTIGLTVVALGTSLPELFVNIFSSLRGESDLIIGNIAGSNIANTFLVLGVGALLITLPFSKNSFKIDIPLSLSAVYVLLFLVFFNFFFFGGFALTRIHGFIFLLLFMGFLFVIFKRKEEFVEDIDVVKSRFSFLYVFLGALGLFIGGRLVVTSAVSLSSYFGISTMFIGSSLIALGTSLPELVTIIVSVFKNKKDLAIGNVVGSNIFNILLVLGVSAIISPVAFSSLGVLNFLFVGFSTLLLAFFLFFNKNKNHYNLNKVHGVIFLLLYFLYLAFLYFY